MREGIKYEPGAVEMWVHHAAVVIKDGVWLSNILPYSHHVS